MYKVLSIKPEFGPISYVWIVTYLNRHTKKQTAYGRQPACLFPDMIASLRTLDLFLCLSFGIELFFRPRPAIPTDSNESKTPAKTSA
jgi:hypothetical protein